MTARDLLRIVREGWLIILASIIVFAGAGFAYSATRTAEYRATASVTVSACISMGEVGGCNPVEGMGYAADRAGFYSDLATDPAVMDIASEEAAVEGVSPSALAGAATVSRATGSPVINISVTWTDPKVAADLADAIADAYVTYANDSALEVEPEAANLRFASLGDDVAPGTPIGSDRRTLVLLTLLGAVLGFALALGKWALDRRVRDVRDAEDFTGLDVLASVPMKPGDVTPSGFHELRSILSSRVDATPAAIVAVVSPHRGETSAAVVDGLAQAFTAARSSVATVHTHGSESGVSLGAILDGARSPEAVLAEQPADAPMVFSHSDSRDSSGVAFSTPQFESFLGALREASDVVLLDVAPAPSTAAMTSGAQHADVALVLVEPGSTTRPELGSVLRTLELIAVPAVGLVAIERAE